MTEAQGRLLQPANDPARPKSAATSEAHAPHPQSASGAPSLAPQALLAMQRGQGNRAVQRMLASKARPAPARAAVQRHDEHNGAADPAALGAHYDEAVRVLKLGLDRLGQAESELNLSASHGIHPTITAWSDWIETLITDTEAAEVARAAKNYKAEKALWERIKAGFTHYGFVPTDPVMQQLEAHIALTDTNRHAGKLDKYVERGQKLFDSGDFVHAAVHWERAYALKTGDTPDFQVLAFEIGQAYKAGGDKERAAPWYRKVLLVPDFTGRATSALGAMGMPTAPKFTATKAVDAHYTSISKENLTKRGAAAPKLKAMKESGKAAEELQTGALFPGITDALLKLLTKVYPPTAVGALENSMRNTMGVTEYTLKDLLIEFARFQIVKGGAKPIGVLADVQAIYPATLPADLASGGWPSLATLAQSRVTYLKSTAERDPYKLVAEGGLIKQGTPPGPPTGYDTKDQSTNASGKGYAIFVMNADGSIYANTHKIDRFHHSSFLAGGEAAGAGEVKITAGELKEISNKSGHYQPGPEQLVQSVTQFKELGSVSGARLRYHVGPQGKIVSWTGGPDDFVTSAADPVIFARRLNEEKAAQGGHFIK